MKDIFKIAAGVFLGYIAIVVLQAVVFVVAGVLGR